MFSRPKNLIPCFLTFCSTIEFNPYLPFKFLIFYHSGFNMHDKENLAKKFE